MYKVIIVDDNRMELETIKEFVMELGFKLNVSVEASFRDGVSAANYVIENPVDIIITDIQMPHMDGIELIEFLQRYDINSSVIFITCYDDLDYTHKAIELGIDSYVLKPVLKDELEKALKKVVEKCVKKRKSASVDSYIKENFSKLKASFLKTLLLNDSIGEKEIKNNEEVFDVKLTDRYICLILYRKSDNIDDIIKKLLNRTGYKGWQVNISEEEEICICASEHFIDVNHLKHLIDEILLMVDRKHFFGISNAYFNPEKYSVLVEESRFALLAAENFDFGKCIIYETVEFENISLGIPFNYMKLKGYISEIVLNEKKQKIDEFINEYITLKNFRNRDGINDLVYIIINIIFSVLKEVNVSFENVISGDILFKKLSNFNEILNLKQWLYNFFLAAIEAVKESATPNKILVNRICEYIHVNYAKKITLDDISKAVNVSKRQIHRVFMSQKQMSILDYITEYRINMAKQMLKKKNSKVYLVAMAVGYSSKVRFSSLFKEKTGMTPSEYKTHENQ